MNIQFKFLATLICLFWGIGNSSIANTYASKENGLPCYEPAPINFHVTDIFTNEIRVAWDTPANQPFEYNIKVFETSSGNLIQNFNIPGNLTIARATNLQPGTEYEIRNTPVCPDGTLSDFYAFTGAETLIIELVSSGFTADPSPSASCSFNAINQYCESDPEIGNVVTFKIRKTIYPYSSRYFGVYKVSDQCTYTTIKVRPIDNGSTIQFYCDDGNGPNCPGTFATIKNSGIEVAKLGFDFPIREAKRLVCVSISPNYVIERFGSAIGTYEQNYYGCGGNGYRHPNPDERNAEDWEFVPSNSTLSANPNPFTNQLDIQVPFANINENVELNLYDLQGRRVMTMRSPGDQQIITLNTEKWSPGMYFLRAESGGLVQTVKVVKTE